MAVLTIEFDNFLCFDNFVADFTYPKKLVNSSLKNECLKKFPNIRVRKANIIIGSNASGKTSFGRAIWHVFMFLKNKEAIKITSLIKNVNKDTNILMDYIDADGLFSRIEILAKANNQGIDVKIRQLEAKPNDTYEMLVKRLPNDVLFENYIVALEKIIPLGWNFVFPSIESGGFELIYCDFIKEEEKPLFCKIFKNVLIIMDVSIKTVYPSNEVENSYIIVFVDNTKIHISHGDKINEIKKLSSGTKYAANIAQILFCISKYKNGFYFVDEQFSYVNSDIEIACLSKMISLLGDSEQLFFTTHNTEILNLNLPIHSFNFLVKEKNEDGVQIKWLNASQFEKRNNVRIKNLYDNNYFDISPNVNPIFDIGESC
ncbi:MAG TPA: ATP-binding protein [Erysipelotrichaceae bacterium]|nr:ATP-binding protein [Erysipelotrichaceae bacterium]